MKKILSLVLVLSLVLSMGTVAMVASATGTTIKIEANTAQAEVGDTITVTFTMPSLDQNILGGTIKYSFDTTLLTPVTGSINGTFSADSWAAGDSSFENGWVTLQIGDPSYEVPFTPSDTMTITAQFKAIAEGTANFAFLPEEELGADLTQEDWDSIPYDEIQKIETSVKIGSGGVEPVPEPTYFTVTFDIDGTTTDVDVEEGSKVDASKVPAFPVSAEWVYAWDKDVTADIDAETTFTAVKSKRTYSVTAVNATATYSSVGYKEAVTVTAEDEKDGKAFSYFTKDGKVVSYEKTYKLLVYADTTIEAVYNGEASAVASAFIDAPYYTMKGNNIKMVSSLQVVLPAGVTVESYSIYRKTRTSEVAYDADALKATTPTTPDAKFNKQGRLDYSVLTSKTSAKFVDIMFVAKLSDGSTVESNVVSAGASLAG